MASSDNQAWTSNEVSMFQASLLKYDKDFYLISHEVSSSVLSSSITLTTLWLLWQIKSKSVKECIEFYYLWKKHFPDIIKRLRMLRRKRDPLLYSMPSRNGIDNCSEVGATRKSRNANGALELELNHSLPKRVNPLQRKSRTNPYSCGQCGKTFKKLRSRSAHMRSHANL